MNRPKIILLVGPPGVGKTTYANKYITENPNTIHLSSDSIRKELWGDEAIQGDNNEVFSLMQTRAIEALNHGQNVIYDATNMTRKDRSYIIALCPKFVQIEAHIVWAPIKTCVERDAARERTVGKEVIDKMLKRFQTPYYDEGIDEIKIIHPDEFDREKYINECFNAMKIPHDNPHHTLNIYDHCISATEHAFFNLFTDSIDDDVLTAILWHDVGKPYVKAFMDGKNNPCEHAHFYQHHCVGAWMVCGVFDSTNISWLVSTHMDPFLDTKYYKRLPVYLKEKVDLLHAADLAAH